MSPFSAAIAFRTNNVSGDLSVGLILSAELGSFLSVSYKVIIPLVKIISWKPFKYDVPLGSIMPQFSPVQDSKGTLPTNWIKS